jgi:predicted dehydrogenase
MKRGKINVAIVGLGFGECFVPIYLKHPDVAGIGICDTSVKRLKEVSEKYDVSRAYTDIDQVLGDKSYDAVHILTPVTTHGPIALKVLKAGKHCACAVPMGISTGEIDEIIRMADDTGLNYMMMETMVYGYEYLFAKKLYDEGTLGTIQFMRGCHYQDLEDINPLWQGLPPMWYMTHAVSPLLAIMDTTAMEVHCYGSGTMRKEFQTKYGNPYPMETAIFALNGTPAKMEMIFKDL